MCFPEFYKLFKQITEPEGRHGKFSLLPSRTGAVDDLGTYCLGLASEMGTVFWDWALYPMNSDANFRHIASELYWIGRHTVGVYKELEKSLV